MSKLLAKILFGVSLMSVIGMPAMAQEVDYYAQEPARSLFEIPPRDLIDAPTAGTLPRGCFHIIMNVYNNGGILAKTAIGLSNRLMLGISYGAEGIISHRSTNRNPDIEFDVKLRLIDEEYLVPAFAIGFSSQGTGAYLEDWQRYAFKSKGFYAVLSRSFEMYKWRVDGHAGANYSLENDFDHDEEPSFFFGLNTRFSYDVGLTVEYDIALNDDRSSVNYAKGRGYLNMGIKWFYSENLELEFILKDLLINRREGPSGVTTFGRELRFTYIEFF